MAGQKLRVWVDEEMWGALEGAAIWGKCDLTIIPAPPPDLLERLGKGPGPAITDLARDAAAKEVKR